MIIFPIISSFLVLSAVAKINQAIDVGDPERTYEALTSTEACITNLDETNIDRYQILLRESKLAKSEVFFTYIGSLSWIKFIFKVHKFGKQYVNQETMVIITESLTWYWISFFKDFRCKYMQYL